MASTTEQLIFDIFYRDRGAETGLSRLGLAGQHAADDIGTLKNRLDEVSRKSVEARVGLKGNAEAEASLDKIQARLVRLNAYTANPNIKPEGIARAAAEIAALSVELDRLGKQAPEAQAALSGLAGPSGMGALIGAGVALAPVIATVSVGLAGFGLAAAGVAKPVLDAAQKTGGLAANMSKLDPEQRKLAQSVLGLGRQYQDFEKALQPEVLGVFNKAIQIAGHLMHDIQPIAKATGGALGGLLDRVDKEFQSGEWQQFFGWMAANVGPDFQLIDQLAIDLLKTLPTLLRDLQPPAHAFLILADAAVKAADAYAKFIQTEAHKGDQPGSFGKQVRDLFHDLTRLSTPQQEAAKHQAELNEQIREGSIALPVNDTAVKKLAASESKHATAMQNSASAAALEKLAINNLTGAINNLIGPLLTAEQGEVAWKQAQKAATAAIDQNKFALDGNTKAALAARSAIIQSTQSALQYAQAEVKQHGDVKNASQVIQDQIQFLQQHAGKSRIATAEIDALRAALRRLPAKVVSNVDVVGHGRGGISFHDQIAGQKADGTLEFHAKGYRVPGYGGGDTYGPIMVERGETIVPKHLTPMIAPLMKAHRIPGFAAGGLYGAGSPVNSAIPWMSSTEAAFERAAIRQGIADAEAAGRALARRSVSVSSGALGGDARANEALARRIFPWPASQWPAFFDLAMRESGFSRFARNKSSGAYGIPQALPESKLPFAGQQAGGSHAGPQLSWMFSYIASRYGNPVNAWGHELSAGWYDQGGWLPPGPSLAYNATGQPEQVLAPGSMARVEALLAAILRATQLAPAATAAGVGKSLNGVARGAVGAR